MKDILPLPLSNQINKLRSLVRTSETLKQADNHSGSNFFKEKIRHLQSTLYDVHNSIIDYSHANKEYDGMGTTLSVLLLLKNKALIGHVGDHS